MSRVRKIFFGMILLFCFIEEVWAFDSQQKSGRQIFFPLGLQYSQIPATDMISESQNFQSVSYVRDFDYLYLGAEFQWAQMESRSGSFQVQNKILKLLMLGSRPLAVLAGSQFFEALSYASFGWGALQAQTTTQFASTQNSVTADPQLIGFLGLGLECSFLKETQWPVVIQGEVRAHHESFFSSQVFYSGQIKLGLEF